MTNQLFLLIHVKFYKRHWSNQQSKRTCFLLFSIVLSWITLKWIGYKYKCLLFHDTNLRKLAIIPIVSECYDSFFKKEYPNHDKKVKRHIVQMQCHNNWNSWNSFVKRPKDCTKEIIFPRIMFSHSQHIY